MHYYRLSLKLHSFMSVPNMAISTRCVKLISALMHFPRLLLLHASSFLLLNLSTRYMYASRTFCQWQCPPPFCLYLHSHFNSMYLVSCAYMHYAGFLELLCPRMSVCVFMCVCPPPRLLITSGMMWCDIDPKR